MRLQLPADQIIEQIQKGFIEIKTNNGLLFQNPVHGGFGLKRLMKSLSKLDKPITLIITLQELESLSKQGFLIAFLGMIQNFPCSITINLRKFDYSKPEKIYDSFEKIVDFDKKPSVFNWVISSDENKTDIDTIAYSDFKKAFTSRNKVFFIQNLDRLVESFLKIRETTSPDWQDQKKSRQKLLENFEELGVFDHQFKEIPTQALENLYQAVWVLHFFGKRNWYQRDWVLRYLIFYSQPNNLYDNEPNQSKEIKTDDETDFTELFLLALLGRVDAMECLLSKVEEPDFEFQTRACDGITVLHATAFTKHTKMMEYLIKRQIELFPDQKIQDLKDSTENDLSGAAACGGNTEMVSFLNDKGFDIKRKSSSKNSPLASAVIGNQKNMFLFLVKQYDLNPKERTSEQLPLPFYAAFAGHIEMLTFLMDTYQFDPKEKDEKGNTLLHAAASNDHLHMIQFLISEYSLDPLDENQEGKMPIDLTTDEKIRKALNSEYQSVEPISLTP